MFAARHLNVAIVACASTLSAWPQDRNDVEAEIVTAPVLDGDTSRSIAIAWRRQQHRIVALRWLPDDGPPIEVPIVTSTQDAEVRTTSDGRRLVVLAGGRREPLDVYLVVRGADGGRFVRVATRGARLPDAYQRGRGSWPELVADDVWAFAHEVEDRIVYRAVDAAGADLAVQTVSRETTGHRHAIDERRGRIVVTFDGDPARVEFVDPSAPHLLVSRRRLEFEAVADGSPVRQSLTFRNVGRRPLIVEGAPMPSPFRLLGPPRWTIAPGEEVPVVVEFQPTREAGVHDGSLALTANGAAPGGIVVLQARVEPVATAPASIHREPGSGAPETPPAETAIGNGSARPAITPPAPVRQPSPSDGPAVPAVPVEPLPPSIPLLRVEGHDVHVTTTPQTPFLVVATDPTGRIVLQVYRGVSDLRGRGRLVLPTLDRLSAPVRLVVLAFANGTPTESTPLVVPAAADSGR